MKAFLKKWVIEKFSGFGGLKSKPDAELIGRLKKQNEESARLLNDARHENTVLRNEIEKIKQRNFELMRAADEKTGKNIGRNVGNRI